MRNNHNPYFSSQTVIRAAAGLAKLVKEHGKPIAFDISDYAQVVAGIHSGKHVAIDPSVLDNLETSEEALKEMLAHQNKEKLGYYNRQLFVEALKDAFSIAGVYSIMPCLLVEVGHCKLDWEETAATADSLPDNTHVPTAEEVVAELATLLPADDTSSEESNECEILPDPMERNWYLVIPQPQAADCFVLDL